MATRCPAQTLLQLRPAKARGCVLVWGQVLVRFLGGLYGKVSPIASRCRVPWGAVGSCALPASQAASPIAGHDAVLGSLHDLGLYIARSMQHRHPLQSHTERQEEAGRSNASELPTSASLQKYCKAL